MRNDDSPDVVPPEALQMIGAWTTVPAFIRDRHLNIVASNHLAKELSPIFTEGVNLARIVFTPGELPLGVEIDPQQIADKLKESLARYESDAEFETIVDELSSVSSAFVEAWGDASETVEPLPFQIRHERVGPLSLTYQAMTMPVRSDLSLAVLRGTDDSSRAALKRLADIISTPQI
ncbi:hypothetical protein [Herbiconiux sp. VKM Ac-2851]|uniref:MmyB family transcriptional regulator n=1 Tax=Herbiconiux sp. VKM Ac-2851 TaxID=2739025 RepID=UPI0015661543|nr:hypothetical protein [Herbiconiux sp. VKM Ac-2851]NQX34484.1 hypothetical protein [Herbiconiux sp. VKM Ac-2851]